MSDIGSRGMTDQSVSGGARAGARPRILRARVLFAALLAMALVASACSGGDDGGGDATQTTAEVTPELQKVIDAARQEGALALSWAPGFLGDAEGAERLISGFKKYYGLDIDVKFTPGSGQGETATKIEQEHRANLPATTDVLSMNSSGALQVAERGILLKVDWKEFSGHITDKMISVDGAAVGVQAWVLGIVYHTGRVSAQDVPKTMQDLLDPKYKGRIYTTPFGGGFDLLASPEGWGRERTIAYAQKFAKQVGGLGFNIQPILSGEFDIMALIVPPSSALKAKKEGAPVEFVIPQDAALLYQNLMAVPVNAAHPNAAKLFIDYLMSPSGQTILRETDFADSPLVEGSFTGKQIEEAESKGAKFINADVAFYARQDREQYQKNVKDLLGILLDRDD